MRFGRLRLRAPLEFGLRVGRSLSTTTVIIVTVISFLVPSMFIDWLGGGAVFASSSSQGPRSATSSGDCTHVASTNLDWTSPGNAFSDNSSYAQVAGLDGADPLSSDYLQCVNYGFSIPSGVTISGIVVTLERKSDSTGNGGSSDKAIRVVKGGTIGTTDRSTATAYTTSDVKEDHGSSSDLWGDTFSVSDVNASNFGAAIRVQKASSAGGSHTVTVDAVQVTVHYTFNPTFEQSSYRWFNNSDAAGRTFVKTLGGSAADSGASVVETSDGGYTVAGSTSSYGSGGSDLWLAKFSEAGIEEWTKTLGGSSTDGANDLIATSDGGFVTTGGTSSYGGGGTDLWLTKFNSSGVEQWTKTLQDLGSDSAYGVIEASDGSFVTVGQTDTGTGLGNLWISKFNSSGVEQWTKELSGSNFDGGISVVESSDGGFVITGTTESYGVSQSELWIAKFNSSGVEQWTKTIGNTGGDDGYDIVATSDNGFVTTGATNSYGAGNQDVWLTKWNSSGVEQWTVTLGGTSTEIGYGVVETADSGFAVTGYTQSNGGGGKDLWLAKFNSSGVEQWNTTFGSTGAEEGADLIEATDGSFIVTGYTASHGAGGNDLLLAKFDSSGSITNCSSLCTSPSLTESTQTITEGSQTLTETNVSITEANQTITESTQSTTESAVVAVPAIDVGSALNGVSQDTATTALAEGSPFRLRMTLHVGTDPALVEGAFAFKLQYAKRGADNLCDTSFTNETYADVTSSSSISYYDNTQGLDGGPIATNANDPSHSGHTNVNQDYNEANNANITSTVTAGQDGLWDFALTDNGAQASTPYCFRMVTSAGAALNTYSVVPMITTLPPDFGQAHYRWFNGQDAVANNTFIQTLGSTGSDTGRDVVQTRDGGYIVVGGTTSFGATNGDLYLAKYDSSGSEEWTKIMGGTFAERGNSVIQTPDGGYVVTGYTATYGAGGVDLWLVKFNSSGVEQWTKTLGGTGNEFGESVVRTTDGGYAVVGSTTSFGAGNSDILIAKFSSSGAEQWTKTLGGSNADSAADIIQTTDGGYAVTGQGGMADSFGDLVLAKVDNKGVEEWTKTVGTTNLPDFGSSLIQTSDGGYVVTGNTTSYGIGDDAWVLKFDASGAEEWTRTYGGTESISGIGIAQTADGGYILSATDLDEIDTAAGGLWLVKLEWNGIVSWNKMFAGSLGDEVAGPVIQTSDGGYAVTGTTGSYGATGSNLWLIKTNSSGGVNACPSTLCTAVSITTAGQTLSESNQSVTEADQSLSESDQSLTESDQTSSTVNDYQAGHMSYGVTLGGTGADAGRSIIQTSNGGFAMTGETALGAGSTDLWISAFDALGAEQWTKTLGSTGSETSYDLIETSDGGYAVTGGTSLGTGSNDIWISKFNSSGVEQWTKTLNNGASANVEAYAIIQTSDSGYAVTGRNSLGLGIYDLWLAKFDSSGVEQWTTTLTPGAINFGEDLVQTSDGGFVTVGESDGVGAGNFDLMLSKFDSSGVEQWTKTLGGTSADLAYSMIQTTDGSLVVTGETASYGAGSNDLWISKFDSSGVEQWTKTLGGTGNDSGYDLVQASDGGFAVTGQTASYGAGGDDLWISKFDSSGVEQWTKTVGGAASDYGRAITQASDGGYVVAGLTNDYGAGGNDLWIVKFGSAGETPGCSSGCTFQSISESSQSISESDQSITEVALTITEAAQTLTESSQTLTENYFMSLGLWTEMAAIPSIPLGAQDVAGDSTRHDNPLRLRMILDPTKSSSVAAADLKLQVAAKVGNCDTSFTGESYADISSSTYFDYYDSGSLADGDWARAGGSDPIPSGTLYYENYEESANFTNRDYLPGSGFGMWDISLNATGNAVYGSYCFRVVHSNDTLLDGYTRIFEISMPPAPSQQMRHGRFFDSNAGTSQPFYW